MPANDQVIIIIAKTNEDFNKACMNTFGPHIILNLLFVREEHTPMSAPQLATVLEVAHNVAPNYSLKKYQCYWYALIVFLMARKQTKGEESNECITSLGKLWWPVPVHSADDNENVVQDEYDRAWVQFEVSHCKFLFPSNH